MPGPAANPRSSLTLDFFENYRDEFDVYISEIAYHEITKTNNIVKRDQPFDAIKKCDLEAYETMNDEIGGPRRWSGIPVRSAEETPRIVRPAYGACVSGTVPAWAVKEKK